MTYPFNFNAHAHRCVIQFLKFHLLLLKKHDKHDYKRL